MLELNENVIHKTAGACVVSNIIKKDFGNGEKTYYYLIPKFPSNVNKTLEIFLPTDREEQFIRKPISKEEVVRLIRLIPSMERVWIPEAKKRKVLFEQIAQSGNVQELCKLVKLLYSDVSFFPKPLSLTDKTFLTKIKTNVFDEFAVALETTPSEIETMVSEYLK